MRQPVMLNNSIKFLTFIIVLLFNLGSTIAYSSVDTAKNTISIPLDSSKVTVRKLNAAEQKALLANPVYKYDRVGPVPESLWERFKDWLSRTFDKIFASSSGQIGWAIFRYILIVAVIVILIYLLVKNEIRALFYGKSATVEIDFKEFDEDIHKINFDELIEEAISKKDYRKAVRLHFLKLLKDLTDNNLIKWKIDKTNKDYSMELANSKYNAMFNQLSLTYEYIWYGDFQLDETNFKTTIAQFKQFKV